jgi:hypothetical protein
MARKKKWSEMSGAARAAIVVIGAVEFVLLAAALVDIRRRPAAQIRGPKRMWRGLAFVSIIGPVSYFVYGRRRETQPG